MPAEPATVIWRTVVSAADRYTKKSLRTISPRWPGLRARPTGARCRLPRMIWPRSTQ
jgi:hypothetical protein